MIKKLIKMIMEALIMTTIKIGNNSKSGHVEKNQRKQ